MGVPVKPVRACKPSRSHGSSTAPFGRRGADFSAIVELLKAMAHGAGRNKEEIVSLLTAVPTEDLQTALRARGQDTGDACQSEDDPSNRPECNDCGKTFSRQCELK